MFPVTIQFIKTHSFAKLPKYNHADPYTGDSGFDVHAVENVVIPKSGSAIVPVGLKLGFITPGYWFKVEGRSGLGFKHGITPHFGIIDCGYRGDLGIKLYNNGDKDYSVSTMDKIAQFIVYPLIQANISFIDEVQATTRGEKGFGSSDKLLPGEVKIDGTIAQF